MLKAISAHGTQKSKFRAVGCLYRRRRSFYVANSLQFRYLSSKGDIMAKVTGFFTGVRGKVGTTIFQVIKGVQVMKTFAIPENPGSSGQVAQRGVFSDIVSCFKTIAKNVIALLWESTTSGNQTSWGNFISKNLISMGKVAFDLTDAILSYGTLDQVSDLEATYDTATGAVVAAWAELAYVNGAAEDTSHIIIIDSDSKQIIGKFMDSATREDEADSVTASTGFTATNLEVFVFFTQNTFASGDPGLVSTSVNCTCTASV